MNNGARNGGRKDLRPFRHHFSLSLGYNHSATILMEKAQMTKGIPCTKI